MRRAVSRTSPPSLGRPRLRDGNQSHTRRNDNGPTPARPTHELAIGCRRRTAAGREAAKPGAGGTATTDSSWRRRDGIEAKTTRRELGTARRAAAARGEAAARVASHPRRGAGGRRSGGQIRFGCDGPGGSRVGLHRSRGGEGRRNGPRRGTAPRWASSGSGDTAACARVAERGGTPTGARCRCFSCVLLLPSVLRSEFAAGLAGRPLSARPQRSMRAASRCCPWLFRASGAHSRRGDRPRRACTKSALCALSAGAKRRYAGWLARARRAGAGNPQRRKNPNPVAVTAVRFRGARFFFFFLSPLLVRPFRRRLQSLAVATPSAVHRPPPTPTQSRTLSLSTTVVTTPFPSFLSAPNYSLPPSIAEAAVLSSFLSAPNYSPPPPHQLLWYRRSPRSCLSPTAPSPPSTLGMYLRPPSRQSPSCSLCCF